MLTTSHALIGYLIYEKKSRKDQVYAVFGSILPDATFFLVMPFLAITSFQELMQKLLSHQDIYVNGIDFVIGATLNSIWLWIAMLLFGKFFWKLLLPLAIGATAHIMADLLTHQGTWAWNHLYPLSVAPVQGPFDFMNPWFLIVEHAIWIAIFIPRIWRYYKMKAA